MNGKDWNISLRVLGLRFKAFLGRRNERTLRDCVWNFERIWFISSMRKALQLSFYFFTLSVSLHTGEFNNVCSMNFNIHFHKWDMEISILDIKRKWVTVMQDISVNKISHELLQQFSDFIMKVLQLGTCTLEKCVEFINWCNWTGTNCNWALIKLLFRLLRTLSVT